MKETYEAKIGKIITSVDVEKLGPIIETPEMRGIEIDSTSVFRKMVHKTYPLTQSTPSFVLTYKDQLYSGVPPSEASYEVESGYHIVFFQNCSKTAYRWRCKLIKESMTPDELINIVKKIVKDYITYLQDRQKEKLKLGTKTLESVILPAKLKSDITSDITNFLNNKEKYKKMNLTWKRGYIFWGPPGNGKTLLLRKLGDAFGLKLVDMLEKLDESGNLRLPRNNYYDDEDEPSINIHRLATDEDEDTPPEIWYLEDMDKVIGRNDKDFAKITLSNFLTAIDGVKKLADGIILIGTTNNRDSLETSILGRPGRFERVYHFDKPSEVEIKAFFDYRQFVIQGKNATSQFVEKIHKKKFSMAFVEDFVLSCITQQDGNVVTEKIANIVISDLEEHNKIEVEMNNIGFSSDVS